MMPHKAKHYENEKDKYTFNTQDMEKAVAEYNNYLDALNKIDDYLNGKTQKPDYVKKEVPFGPVISSVALAIAKLQKDEQQFTTYMTGQIVSNFKEYEAYFNTMGNEFEKIKYESNQFLWQAAVKISEEFENIADKINLLPLQKDALKKVVELTELSDKTKKGLNKVYNRVPSFSKMEWAWLSSHSDVSFDAIKIVDAIESLAQLTEFHENEIKRAKEAKKKEDSEKRANLRFAEEYKAHKQEVADLQAKNKDLQAEINKLMKLIDSPHTLAAKDLAKKFKAGIGKVQSRKNSFKSGKER